MYSRPYPNLASPTGMFVASGATSLVAPSNTLRAHLVLQGNGPFYMGAASGVPSAAAGMPGLLIASGVLSPDALHTGPVYAFSGLANGATVAITIWESSLQGA
jgi:hypothetical protein